jgi:hypothetical protein
MLFTPPTGSGILLCPTGQGFSTISDDEYAVYESDNTVTIEEIDVSVFQEWFSNAKEIEESVRATYAPATDGFEDYFASGLYEQGVGDAVIDSILEFNTSDHPLPKMDYVDDVLNYRSELDQLLLENDDFDFILRPAYWRVYEGVRYQLSGLPIIFIRNDKFYWVRRILPPEGEGSGVTATLTETEHKLVSTVDLKYLPDEGEESIDVTATLTSMLRITKRFY